MVNVLDFGTARIQREIRKLLNKSAQKRLRRSTIIRSIMGLASEKLKRGEKRMFAHQVNLALGGLQNRKPPIVTTSGRGAEVIVLRGARKKKRPELSFQQLVRAVNARMIAVTFRCEGCERPITVRDVENEIQCRDCDVYFQ